MDWHPLCNEDPFPGDPGALSAAATAMNTMATHLHEQATLLQGYVNNIGQWQGEAKDAFATKVGDLPPKIFKAHDRYDAGGKALAPYAKLLETSQGTARQLLTSAISAQHDIDRLKGALHEQQRWEKEEATRATLAQTDPSHGSPTAAQWHGPNNASQLHEAVANLARLRAKLVLLQTEFSTTAQSVATQISAAAHIENDDGGLKGWAEHRAADIRQAAKAFVEYSKEHGLDLAVLSDLISKVSSFLSILAIFPIPGVQEVLAAVAGGLAVAALVIDTVLLLAGEKNLKSWAGEAVGLLLPMAATGAGALALAKSGAKGVAALEGGASVVGKTKALSKDYAMLKDAAAFQKDMKTMKRLNRVKEFVGLSPSSVYKGLNGNGLRTSTLKTIVHGTAAENHAKSIIALTKTGNSKTLTKTVQFLSGANTVVKDIKHVDSAVKVGQYLHLIPKVEKVQ